MGAMTVTHEEISAVLGRYLGAHPDGAADVHLLSEALDSEHDLAARRLPACARHRPCGHRRSRNPCQFRQTRARTPARFRFAFWATDAQIAPQLEEVIAVAWRSPADLPTARLADSVAAI
jgi:hypothetical protein